MEENSKIKLLTIFYANYRKGGTKRKYIYKVHMLMHTEQPYYKIPEVKINDQEALPFLSYTTKNE